MEKVITVDSKKKLQTKTGKDYIAFTDTEDERYSVFDPKLFSKVQEGQSICLHGEQDGQYFNLNNITVAEKPVKVESTRDASIARQVAAKIIAELWIAERLNPNDLEVSTLRDWLQGQFPVQTGGELIPDSLVEEAKALGATEAPEFKNVGEFLLAAYKEFHLCSSKVLKLLDCKIPSDITDLNGAWVVLTQSMKEE